MILLLKIKSQGIKINLVQLIIKQIKKWPWIFRGIYDGEIYQKFLFNLLSASALSSSRAISEQKVKMKRLGTDLTSAQKEMKAKHKAYENAVGILSRRLQEALAAKETAEAELVKLRAQVSEGGNSLELQVNW